MIFLPIVLGGFVFINASGHTRASIGFLVVSSLFFYGWWEPAYLLLITSSIVFNFVIARILSKQTQQSRTAKSLLIIGVSTNLGALGFFKYTNFFIDTFTSLSGKTFDGIYIILPLAISFFTFQQIAYLVDVYRKQADETDLLSYSLFVTFFPQLVAGPIVHHSEMMGQFKKPFARGNELWSNISVGLTIFTIGLFKKVVIADKMAFWSDRVFNGAQLGGDPTFIEAWVGVISFTFQIYFDFSGYSDMAIGLARMFGIRLPLNFDSPYKATNIVDFWRRWHMTLSRFLRDYVYFPLGGNRNGRARRYTNLMIVMALGGLWHGAGWTFVLWGILHGAYLALNHLWWNIVGHGDEHEGRRLGRTKRWTGRIVTLLSVSFAWTLFRAESLDSAIRIYKGLFTFNGIVLPPHYQEIMGDMGTSIASLGVGFANIPHYGGGMQLVWIVGVLMLVWLMPSTQEFMCKFDPALDFDTNRKPQILGKRVWAWQPSLKAGAAFGLAALFLTTILLQGQSGEFIYFQF
ncbi:MAG: MBOAT family protein [Magnetovibrio sp.]|nr:MBOAT family protein [Magnetovibrio sp.]